MEARFFDYGLTFVPPVPLAPEGLALLVVDMQYHDAAAGKGFCEALERIEPGSCAYFDDRNEHLVVPTITRLVDGFRDRGIPIVYLCLGSEHRDLRDVPPRMRAWIRAFEERAGMQDVFWRGNPLYAVREEFAPRPEDTVIHKTTFGAFNSSGIDRVLRHMGIENLVVVGISTNCCIETTARDAADRGYGVVVVDEGTADYDAAAHDAMLRGFHFNFGRVLGSAEDVLAAVDARAEV